MSKIGQVYHILEVLISVYWHLQTQLLMSAAEIRAQVFILSLSDMIRNLQIELKWLEKHSWGLCSKSVQLLKRCIYSTVRIKKKNKTVRSYDNLIFSDFGIPVAHAGAQFMCLIAKFTRRQCSLAWQLMSTKFTI